MTEAGTLLRAGRDGQRHGAAAGRLDQVLLRGIKDTPPYRHDGRLMALADTVEFFNLLPKSELTHEETGTLVAYMLTL